MHFCGCLFVSFLDKQEIETQKGTKIVLRVKVRNEQRKERNNFDMLTSIMAFNTIPAPFTIVVDGCYRINAG